jgi:hypothetical protein
MEKKVPLFSQGHFRQIVRSGLEQRYVGCLQALGALFDGKLDSLAFFQIAKTIALDRGIVNEDILATLTLDKAVALASVEPLDRTLNSFRHFDCLLIGMLIGGACLVPGGRWALTKSAQAFAAQAYRSTS